MFTKVLLTSTMFGAIAYAGLVFDKNDNIDGQKFSVEYQITTKSGKKITASKNYQCEKYSHTYDNLEDEEGKKELTTYLPNEKLTKIPLENEEFALVTVPDACSLASYNTIFSKYTCNVVDEVDCSGEFPVQNNFKPLTYWSENDQFNTLIAHYGEESYKNSNAKFKDINAKITYNKIVDETPTAQNMNLKFDPFTIIPVKIHSDKEKRKELNSDLNPYYAKYITENESCNIFLKKLSEGNQTSNTQKFKPFENGSDTSELHSNCLVPLNQENQVMKDMKGLLVYYKTPTNNTIISDISENIDLNEILFKENKKPNYRKNIHLKGLQNNLK